MRKIVFLKMLLIIVFSFNVPTSCNVKKKELNKEERIISYINVFDQKENKYFVLYFLDSCAACQNTFIFLKDEYSRREFNVYFVSILEKNFKKSSYYVDNTLVTNYQDIKIYSVPTLLLLKSNVVENQLLGFENIKEKSLLIYFS